MFKFNSTPVIEQEPLILIVNEDDELLSASPDAEWYNILKNLPCDQYKGLAARYYDALYHFNQTETQASSEMPVEQKDQTAQRLLHNRPTINKTLPVLFQPEFKTADIKRTSPDAIAPGIIPFRSGRNPKCFFALFKSFIGVSLMGFASEPQTVHSLLTSNLSFARVCGFVPKSQEEKNWFKHIPSLRKLEQFDQIMRDYGLWCSAKLEEIRNNIDNGHIKQENVLVGDTTHYHAYSGFETVVYTDNSGKEKRKSQSKLTKNCRCQDRDNCHHPWQLADEGAGTIVKGNNKMIWGHKAAILGLPLQGIPLDATAVADAATYDGETFYSHVKLLFENLPEVKPWIDTALYDSACDDEKTKNFFWHELHIKLRTSINPRRRKSILENLPKGMTKLTAYGNLFCMGGFEIDYKGARFKTEKFIYEAPVDGSGVHVCLQCEHKPICSPLSVKGRVVNVSFNMLPHINSDDPPMAKRFKAMMTRRPSVERMIKRLKCDLSDDRLTKRGNASFQAYLDKTMIAFHILLRQ